MGAAAGPVTTGQKDVGEGDGGGLSWLTEAAGDPAHPAATPVGTPPAAEVDSGNDWLAAAKSTCQAKLKPTQSAIGNRRASNGNAAPAGWMSSGKLGLPAGSDSDEDGGSGSVAAVGAAAKPRKGKQVRDAAASVAGGAGGWLGSAALGVPAEDESDGDGDVEDSGDGRAVMATTETQTEEDIAAVTERGDAPKLPPWAKPWTPPAKPEVVPDDAPEAPSEKEVRLPSKIILSKLCAIAYYAPRRNNAPSMFQRVPGLYGLPLSFNVYFDAQHSGLAWLLSLQAVLCLAGIGGSHFYLRILVLAFALLGSTTRMHLGALWTKLRIVVERRQFSSKKAVCRNHISWNTRLECNGITLRPICSPRTSCVARYQCRI